MNFQKILYYMDNGICHKKNKIMKINMKTGLDILEDNSEEIILLSKKFTDSGIYMANQVHDPDNISKIYFEKKVLCRLLGENKLFLKVSSPKLLLDKIDNYIILSNSILTTIVDYMPKSKDIEILFVNKIEEYRYNNIYKYSQFLIILEDYQKFMYNINFHLYYDMLYIWENMIEFRQNLLYSQKTLLQIILKFIKFEKEFIDFERPIKFLSSMHNLTITDSNTENLKDFILNLDKCIHELIKNLPIDNV